MDVALSLHDLLGLIRLLLVVLVDGVLVGILDFDEVFDGSID